MPHPETAHRPDDRRETRRRGEEGTVGGGRDLIWRGAAPVRGEPGAAGQVCAVVLTYNRRDLLRECLGAVTGQTCPPDHVLVVDNASTDGTGELLRAAFPGVEVVRLEHNAGSASGFHTGLEAAYRRGFGWVWLMDDDVTPEPGALGALIGGAGRLGGAGEEVGFVCSRVVGTNGASMNVPGVDGRPGPNLYPEWETHLALGVVRLRQSTFVSILLPRDTIREVGLPLRDLHTFGEDTEYTLRITNVRPAYLVGGSVVTHHRARQAPLDIALETDPARLPAHFHKLRNDVYIARRYYGRRRVLALYLDGLRRLPRLLTLPHGPRRAALTLLALAAGAFFWPPKEPPLSGAEVRTKRPARTGAV
ncbi:glycosyltransferase family 2 protein [Deinococcus sp. YIM 134068]|uniref:glycosyltransferase family 2 protein n=1 Tax=Deinococcus lichenicola TaxID=3118910 RepID=UPI002F95568A